jgi:hypothetical protein
MAVSMKMRESLLGYSAVRLKVITLMMEAVYTSKMSVYSSETAWHYIPEGCHIFVCLKFIYCNLVEMYHIIPEHTSMLWSKKVNIEVFLRCL